MAEDIGFLKRIVTVDESWVHFWATEMKEHSKVWKKPEEEPPRKFKTQPSAGKLMLILFWDHEGSIYWGKWLTFSTDSTSDKLEFSSVSAFALFKGGTITTDKPSCFWLSSYSSFSNNVRHSTTVNDFSFCFAAQIWCTHSRIIGVKIMKTNS